MRLASFQILLNEASGALSHQIHEPARLSISETPYRNNGTRKQSVDADTPAILTIKNLRAFQTNGESDVLIRSNFIMPYIFLTIIHILPYCLC